jgi:hypothetical protein
MFKDFKKIDIPNLSGIQYLKFFDNGYGVSVIQHNFSRGGTVGLWELAVIRGVDENWSIDYDTPIADDVIGWLDPNEVNEIADKISKLPPIKNYYAVAISSYEPIEDLGPFDTYEKAELAIENFVIHGDDPYPRFKIVRK